MSPYTTREDVCRFDMESELAQACPRRLHLPRRALPLVAAAVCAYLLAGVFAGAVALRSGEMLWLSRFGRVQQATLLGFETLTPRFTGGDSPVSLLPTALGDSADDMTGTLRANYAFVLGGRVRHGWTVASDDYAASPAAGASAAELSNPIQNRRSFVGSRAPAPATIPVRTGWWMGRFVYRLQAMMPAAALSAGQALAATLALVLALWSAAARGRGLFNAYLLLRHGDALVATVRDKEIVRKERPQYWITCGFIALNGQIVACRERCAPEQWRALQIGDAVTVLHLPTRAARLTAGIYRHLPLACASRASVASVPESSRHAGKRS